MARNAKRGRGDDLGVRGRCEHEFVSGDSENAPLRRCGRCGEEQPFANFNWRRRGKGQYDNYCRPCRAAYKREHYLRNRQRYIDQAKVRRTALAHERYAFLIAHFETHPCTDCGESDPLVLEFDHLGDDKLFNIAQGVRDRGWGKFVEEIAKCEVVCANCHRRRTARRAGFVRAVPAESG